VGLEIFMLQSFKKIRVHLPSSYMLMDRKAIAIPRLTELTIYLYVSSILVVV